MNQPVRQPDPPIGPHSSSRSSDSQPSTVRGVLITLIVSGVLFVAALVLTWKLLPSALATMALSRAGVDALERPSLVALVPRIVSRDQLTAAASLGLLQWQSGHGAGPPLALVLQRRRRAARDVRRRLRVAARRTTGRQACADAGRCSSAADAARVSSRRTWRSPDLALAVRRWSGRLVSPRINAMSFGMRWPFPAFAASIGGYRQFAAFVYQRSARDRSLRARVACTAVCCAGIQLMHWRSVSCCRWWPRLTYTHRT